MFITLAHNDHAYVEKRGGFELLTHLRAAEARVTHRREAIQRAYDGYEDAVSKKLPDAEISGRGLVVLQRSFLAAEDLGGLLHAFDGQDPWKRLLSASLPKLTAAFERAQDTPDECLERTARLASEETLSNEPLSPSEREAFLELRAISRRRWHAMLARAAGFWIDNQHVAKATMHGFPFVAGDRVHGPPPAGELSVGVTMPPPELRWALAVTSTRAADHITTHQIPVRLDDRAVAYYHRSGRHAARLYGEFCDLHATSIMRGFGLTVPLILLGRLPLNQQATVREVIDREKPK